MAMYQRVGAVASRMKRFVGSLGIGALATAADFVTLVILVEGMGLRPRVASIPALLVGALVQFVGNREVVFKARDGYLGGQALRFAAAETVALVLNATVFAVLTSLGVPYPIARPIGSFVVFAGVSYPLWKLVFNPNGALAPQRGPAPR